MGHGSKLGYGRQRLANVIYSNKERDKSRRTPCNSCGLWEHDSLPTVRILTFSVPVPCLDRDGVAMCTCSRGTNDGACAS